MANNRLYIKNLETGDEIMLAKSFGTGWSWRKDRKQMQDWLDVQNIHPDLPRLIITSDNEVEDGNE
jgi:hypothetical protein